MSFETIRPEESWDSVPLPLGVADPAGQVGFLAEADRGLAAVDLATGETLWRSGGAHLPLVAGPGWLAAGAHSAGGGPELRIALLDTARQGEEVFTSQPVRFLYPDFRILSARVESGHLLLGWLAWEAVPAGGPAARPPGPRAEGVARVDLRDGGVELLPPAGSPAPPAAVTAEAAKLASWPGPGGGVGPWLAGDFWIALSVAAGGLALHRWQAASGAPLPAVELLSPAPPPGYLHYYGSPDLQHLILLHCNDREMEGAPPGSVCVWLFFSMGTGERIAELAADPGTEPPLFTLGGRVFYTVSETRPEALPRGVAGARILRARELRTGRLLWERSAAAEPIPPTPV